MTGMVARAIQIRGVRCDVLVVFCVTEDPPGPASSIAFSATWTRRGSHRGVVRAVGSQGVGGATAVRMASVGGQVDLSTGTIWRKKGFPLKANVRREKSPLPHPLSL